jgi:hypothetical protein
VIFFFHNRVGDDGDKFISLFVSLVYYAESTVRWFVVREKHCWMAADSADKFKRTGRMSPISYEHQDCKPKG